MEVRGGRGPPAGAGGPCAPVSVTSGYAVYGDALCRQPRASRPGLRIELAPFPRAAEAAARLHPRVVISDKAVPAPGRRR